MGVWISLTLYFLLMLGIGFYAWRKATSSTEGYLLGGRNLGPAVTALSAGASDMSGWLLLGLPGALFAAGLGQAWIGIGLFCGALVNWIVVAPRLRTETERYDNSLTIPEFLSKRFPSKALTLRVLSAVIVVVFFAMYTASGLVAGGKLFTSSFENLVQIGSLTDYHAGIILTLGIVLIYTAFGGFLAVSLTDFVQGCVMMLALIIMPLVVLYGPEGGGLSQARDTLSQIDSSFFTWTHGLTVVGWVSAMAWGLGYFGQPHIIVRFMAIRSVKDVPRARNIGMSWLLVSLIGALGVGVFGRAYAMRNGLVIDDPETIFMVLADLLFHPLVTGFLYAALLAAVMSTISSQLLVASSSLVEDCYRLFLHKTASERESVAAGRVSVVLVGLVAAWIAMDPDSRVLGLVSHAWAGFGAAFGPMILFALLWKKSSGSGAVASLVAGAVTVVLWIVLGWNERFLGSEGVYELIPGFIVASLAMYLVSLKTGTTSEYRAG